MQAKVEHSTLLHWKNYSLYLSIKTFKPTTSTTPSLPITNTHVLLKCLERQFIKAGQPSRPCPRVVLPGWSLSQSPSPSCSGQRMKMNQCRHQPQCRQGLAAAPCTQNTSHHFCQVSWNAWSPCTKHREIAVMHIQNKRKPNMTILDVHWLVNQTFFHLSSLSSVNWWVKLIPPLRNCNIQMRRVKVD